MRGLLVEHLIRTAWVAGSIPTLVQLQATLCSSQLSLLPSAGRETIEFISRIKITASLHIILAVSCRFWLVLDNEFSKFVSFPINPEYHLLR